MKAGYATLTVEIDIAAPGPSVPLTEHEPLMRHWESRLRRELEPSLVPGAANGIRVVGLCERHLRAEA